MDKLIKEKAHNLWLKYNKPKNKDLDIWLEAEKIIYNESYNKDIIYKGEGAYFKTVETSRNLDVILCPYRETKNYRINDVLIITSCYFRYYNNLFIRIKEVDKNGKILDFEWTLWKPNENCNYNLTNNDKKKFGDVSRHAIYIGRLKDNKLVVSNNFYSQGDIFKSNNKINIIDRWIRKHI